MFFLARFVELPPTSAKKTKIYAKKIKNYGKKMEIFGNFSNCGKLHKLLIQNKLQNNLCFYSKFAFAKNSS